MSTDRETFDPTEHLEPPSRPRWRSLDRAEPPPPLARRLALLALLLVAHALLLFGLERWRAIELPRAVSAPPTWVMLLDAPPPPLPPPPSPPPPRRIEAASQPVPARALRVVEIAAAPARDAAPASPPAAARDAAPSTPLRLFRADGSIEMPDAVATDLAAVTRADRPFGFQPPGVMQARSFAQRPRALVYETTRFDKAWQEEKGPITEALEKAVEKTTATISIPMPRSPGSKVVCKVSLLAMGGSCNLVNSGQGFVVVLNDPATLDADEDRLCREWWDQIVVADTSSRWRELRDRYEAECRKPREADAPLPPATG